MGKIPTAEEFIQNFLIKNHKGNVGSNTEMLMIEFAKLHVEAALNEALESIPCLGSSTDIASYEEVEDAVLTAYPPENIK